MNYLKIVPETITDGEGLRMAVYVAGCENRCPGCFNPESWDYDAGEEMTDDVIDGIILKMKDNPILDGISILGGDPFAPKNRRDLHHLLWRLAREGIRNIWVWTGYVKEKLEEDPIARACLSYISVLVDGPFVQELYDAELRFRGSANQRIMRLQPSTMYAPSKAATSSSNLAKASGET